jgi:hypothetical protein
MNDPLAQLPRDLRDYADAVDKDRGFKTGLTLTMRDAAKEIVRLRALSVLDDREET